MSLENIFVFVGTIGEVKGLVVGAFGEVSEELNELVQTLALSRLRTVG